MLDGVDSVTKRQIDVLVEQNIGQYTMQIVIDCKDYAKPVDEKATRNSMVWFKTSGPTKEH